MTATDLPPHVSRELIAERLQLVFPEGTPNRAYCTRDLAASTVFAALYIGAVEGASHRLGPIHVYRMTGEQAARASGEERAAYRAGVARQKSFVVPGVRWYADNTREPIRDETLREGLVNVGAVGVEPGIATTSSRPRYFLKASFAALFDPALVGDALAAAIARFHADDLDPTARLRIAAGISDADGPDDGVVVTLPGLPANMSGRMLAPGPSSLIAKAVIEVFAARFLGKPAVLWLSESGAKVVHQDDTRMRKIGLKIQPDRTLPDLVLADLAPVRPLLVFVEVVATDGAVTGKRRDELLKIVDAGSFPRERVAFVTAYSDREAPGARRTLPTLAWGSFAWFASEPGQLLHMRDGALGLGTLSDLLAGGQG